MMPLRLQIVAQTWDWPWRWNWWTRLAAESMVTSEKEPHLLLLGIDLWRPSRWWFCRVEAVFAYGDWTLIAALPDGTVKTYETYLKRDFTALLTRLPRREKWVGAAEIRGGIKMTPFTPGYRPLCGRAQVDGCTEIERARHALGEEVRRVRIAATELIKTPLRATDGMRLWQAAETAARQLFCGDVAAIDAARVALAEEAGKVNNEQTRAKTDVGANDEE